MFCNYCGTQNPDDVTFCHQCGKRQTATERAQTMERTNSNESSPLETVRRSASSATKLPPMAQGVFQASSPPPEVQTSSLQNSRVSRPQTTQGTIVFALPVSSQTLQQNAGSLAAGIGGIVALFAFLFLPYITITAGLFGQSVNATTIGSSQGLIWFEALLAIGAVVVAALLVFRRNLFGMVRSPMTTQTHPGIHAYTLIAIGALGILGQLLFALNLSNYNYEGGSIMSMGVSYSVGFWLYLLAMTAVTVGGALALVQNHGSIIGNAATGTATIRW